MINCKKNIKTDSDIIEEIIANAEEGIAIIPQRKCEIDANRNYWLIDRAILIPENTTVVLENCKIKLSDQCRDNFFRSANCGMDIPDIKTIKNIHLIGKGYAVLEGAEHPRSTGDAGKILKCPCYKKAEDILSYADWISEEERKEGKVSFGTMHDYTYGTDFDKEGERQKGDWRNVGILFACAEDFSIENLHIVEPHGWGISLENCAYGRVEKIDFDAKMQREIDGILHNIENQDGVDIRNGCHDITISDITGQTGDDLVALTAIAKDAVNKHKNGDIDSTHIMHHDWTKRNPDIYNIIIRNVRGRSQGGALGLCCSVLRLLAVERAKIHDIIIDGVMTVHHDGLREATTFIIGEPDSGYGKCYPDGITNIIISNVICDSIYEGIMVSGYLKDSVISNVIDKNPNCETICVARENGLQNVQICNLIAAKD